MIQKTSILKTVLQHLAAIAVFLLVTVIYFSPQVIDGKVLPQHDVSQFKGASEDLREYYENEGESSAWTGGMFSGMPAYQIGIWGGSPNILDYVEKPIKAIGYTTAGSVFAAMVMAYILFLILGFSIPMAMMGAFAYAFSSYNLIILDAGHVTKAWALAYMPIVVASLLALYKRKFIAGGLCMAIGLALQIKSGHLQMTYYTAILCAFLFIGLVVYFIRQKDTKALLKSCAALSIALVLALLANAGNLYSNYEMSKESTRGKSELTSTTDTDKPATGLEKDYVFGWSYGKAETLSLMIPNIHGGGSAGVLDSSSNLHKAFVANGFGSQIDPKGLQAYTYWGDQPGTSGPVYFGAIICFLFILAMIIIRNPIKWILLAATIFFIFLSWGKNLEWFNDLFYYYFPLYNKFRAVSQALVIPALIMVVVAIWGINEFLTKNIDKIKLSKALYISAGITAAICLFFWIAPNFFFNFTSVYDGGWKSQMPPWYYTATLLDRKDMLTSDAMRSFIFILLSAGVLWFALQSREKNKNVNLYASIALILLVLIDLWGVDKRYLNDAKFVNKTSVIVSKTPADEAILQDKSLSYRVLNLNNPFAETSTSLFHRSIGGYHAAKLQRYQQLIENRLQPEIASIVSTFESQDVDTIIAAFANTPTLNMLDTKYVVFHPEQAPLVNPYANGNAWFVSDYKFVENADMEMRNLNQIKPSTHTVIDKRFEDNLANFKITPDPTANIELTEYKPNKLSYKSETATDQLVVFSEVYYGNGWQAYIDGKKAPHFRADWILRAMVVPAGKHEIVFKFEPHDYNTCRTVATVSSGILVLLLLGTIIYYFIRKEETE